MPSSNLASQLPGEVITANAVGVVAAATTAYKECATITLTPGRWLISGSLTYSGLVSNATAWIVVISTASASATGTNFGRTNIQGGISTFGTSEINHGTFPPVLVTVSVNTPYYLNGSITYTGATPEFNGYIMALRV